MKKLILLLFINISTHSFCQYVQTEVTLANSGGSITFKTGGYTKYFTYYDTTEVGCFDNGYKIFYQGDSGLIQLPIHSTTDYDSTIYEIPINIRISDSIIYNGTYRGLVGHRYLKFKVPNLFYNNSAYTGYGEGCNNYIDTLFINDNAINAIWIYPKSFPSKIITPSITLDSIIYNNKKAVYTPPNNVIDVYYNDTLTLYYSHWKNQTYSFSFASSKSWYGSNPFTMDSLELDSCNGIVKLIIYPYPNFTTGEQGIVYPVTFLINILSGQHPTGISSLATKTLKEGIITIYDSQGRFVKSSSISDYTKGLQQGVLYIYNTTYSDNTIDKGKFIITE